MTIILPNSRFIHIPKTGGTWVSHVLRHSGLQHACCTEPHPPRSISPGSGMFTFAFVRSPLSWYPSYWTYRTQHGWNFHRPFDKTCHANTFKEFMELVFSKRPGYFSQMVVQHYVGQPDDQIEFIGKQENLAEDLMIALDMAGERYSADFPEFVKSFKPVNVSPPELVGEYPEDYAARVYEMDATIFHRFEYPYPN